MYRPGDPFDEIVAMEELRERRHRRQRTYAIVAVVVVVALILLTIVPAFLRAISSRHPSSPTTVPAVRAEVVLPAGT